jgi:hypothetical protein
MYKKPSFIYFDGTSIFRVSGATNADAGLDYASKTAHIVSFKSDDGIGSTHSTFSWTISYDRLPSIQDMTGFNIPNLAYWWSLVGTTVNNLYEPEGETFTYSIFTRVEPVFGNAGPWGP